MDLFLFDNQKNLIKLLPSSTIIECEQSQTLNSVITISIIGEYDKSIEQAQFVGMQDPEDRNVFWRYKINQLKKDDGKFTLTGIYELFDDFKGRSIIKDSRPQGWGVHQALTPVLAKTGWEIGEVISSRTATTSWYYITPLEAFYDFLEKWRVEFRPRMIYSAGKVVRKYIDIYDQRSADYGKWYEYGDNLLTVIAEETLDTISTAFYGRGKGEETEAGGFGRKINFADVEWEKANGDPLDKPLGQEFLEFPEASEMYGYEDGGARYAVVDFSDIEDPAELLQATYAYGLDAIRPKVQFSSTVIEEGLAELGETVTIIRNDLGIRYKTRIFKLTRNLLNAKLKSIEFGDQVVKSTANRISSIIKNLEKNEVQTIDWLDSLRDEALDMVNNRDAFKYELRTGNEYGLPAGTYHFDAPIDENPTWVSFEGAGIEMKANSKNPDGSWNWRTISTPEGYIADNMFAGTISANLIRGGMQISQNGNSLINWDDGSFSFNLGKFQLTPGGQLWLNGIIETSTNDRAIQLREGAFTLRDVSVSPWIDLLSIHSKLSVNGVIQRDAHIVKEYDSPSLRISASGSDRKIYTFIAFSGDSKAGDDKVESFAPFYFYEGITVYGGLNLTEIYDNSKNKHMHFQTGTTFINQNLQCERNLLVKGTKNALVETENYGHRAISAYETAEYYFGDIGSAKLKDGKCKIEIEEIFKETVNTEVEYQVFLQAYGNANIWVSERHKDYFIVQGTDDIKFGWELKAKRKGYEKTRLEKHEIKEQGNAERL